ncbi:hypothetical protein TrVE_jg5896 [Triparma verrucosa]|uniref:Uncharacterized protein n=1 Tax=Triparma verrucosa TaxID=1606542 RepID=A0A9W7F4P1_9STRA|nr:hypothetical protein TrVE_jg5896 [Triparma verrucosa]
MRRRSFDRGDDADTKRRMLLSSSYSQLPKASSSSSEVPLSSSSRPGTTQGLSQGLSRPRTVDPNSGLVRTRTTSDAASLRRRARGLKKKKKPNFPQHPKRPLPRQSAIEYFNEALQETFPSSLIVDESDINVASLLRDPPLVRESMTSPSRTRPPYIETPPPLSLQIDPAPEESTELTEMFPFHSATPFERRRPSSGVNPENILSAPDKIPAELIDHDAKYLKNYKRKVRTNWGVVKIQCWWRCVRHRNKMSAWKARRSDFKGRHFRSWSVLTRADRKFKLMCSNHAFRCWRDLWQDIKYTKYASKVIFEKSITSGRLTVPSVNLFFQDDLDLLDNEEGFEKIKMERTLAGIRRQILTILYKEWVSRSRFAKKRRLAACAKLQSALRKCPSYGTWAGELANTGFHMWFRWANYRLAVKAGKDRPTYPLEILEWNKYVVKWETRRELKAKVAHMGKKTFIKNKFRRWRYYARYLAAQNERMEAAIQHHRRAKINLILSRWCQFCKGRGKAHRRRLVYLLAWKEWAPRESRMRELCKKTIEKVKEVRMRCIMRNWNKRVQHSLVIYAYGNHRLLNCEQPQRLSALKAAYCFLNRTAPFISVICFTKWKRYTARVRHWRAFKFWNYSATCDHVKRAVFRSWYYITAKNWKPIAEKLTLEPSNMIHRGKNMLKRIKAGYDPSNSISDAECERLLCGDAALLAAAPVIGTTDKNGTLVTSPVKVTPKKSDKVDLANIVISAVASEQVSASSSPNTAKREKKRLLQKSMQMQLIDAINICDVPKVRSLLHQGVSANAVSTDGSLRTALHLASEHMSLNFFPVIVLLLRCGASLYSVDSHGKKPIDLTINPHVAALLHQHMGRCEKRQWSTRERKRCMMLLTERSTIGTREMMQYACAEFLATKKHDLEAKLSTLSIDTPKILSASQLTNQTGDQSHLDDAMEELASASNASMDEIVEAVMILQTTVRYHSIGHHVEKAQRVLDGLVDSPDPTEVHFETVASDFKDLVVRERTDTIQLDGDGEGEDENDIGLPPGVEMVGDVRFVGKRGKDNNVLRRKRCAEIFCINSPLGGGGGGVGNKKKGGGGTRKVVHRALAQIIEKTEVVIKAQVVEQGVKVERDNVLLQKAFEREIRMHKVKEVVDPSKIFVTGDLTRLLEERDRSSVLNGGATATVTVAPEQDFTLGLKSKKKDDEDEGNLQAIISISPNTLPRRQIGQDVEVDMVLKNLVQAVPFRNIVEGFADKADDAGLGRGDSDLLPSGWWDRSRTYMALLEEAISLDFRLNACSVRAKELKKKSANLTEAIDVVRKSAFETGSELRGLAKDRVVVDTDNNQILRSSKGAVKKWERFLRDNEAATEKAQADIRRVRMKYSSKILEEEAEAKKRADEERLRADNAKNSPNKKGKKKKGVNKKAASPPPPKKRRAKDGEEEEAKTEEEMTADELGDLMKAHQSQLEDLKKKAESGANNLAKYQDKVKHAEDNIRENGEIISSTVQEDFSVMNQLHTAISDYKREQAKVDAEVKMKIKEGKEIATQIEDVAYTARLIAPDDAPPFEYKLSRGPSPNKGKGGGKKGKKGKGAAAKEEPPAFKSWTPPVEKDDGEEKKDSGGSSSSSSVFAQSEPVRSGLTTVKNVNVAAPDPVSVQIPAGVASPGVTIGKSTAAPLAPAPSGQGEGASRRLSLKEKEHMRSLALSPPVELDQRLEIEAGVGAGQEEKDADSSEVLDNFSNEPFPTVDVPSSGVDADNESLDHGTLTGGSVAPFSPFHDDNDSIERMHPGDLVDEGTLVELQDVPLQVRTSEANVVEGETGDLDGHVAVEVQVEVKKVEQQAAELVEKKEEVMAPAPAAAAMPPQSQSSRRSVISRKESTMSVDSVNYASEESSDTNDQDLVGFQTITETVEPLEITKPATGGGGGGKQSAESSRVSTPPSSIPSPGSSSPGNSRPGSPVIQSSPNAFEGIMGIANRSKSPASPLSPGVDKFISEMSPSKNAMSAEDELMEMYDKALGLLFRRERIRHRKALNEEARRKFEEEETAKEDKAKTQKWKEDKLEKEKARSPSPEGARTPNPAIRPTLMRKRSSIRKDFDKISSIRSGKKRGRKGPGSDEQFYQAVDCHTMRKFMRKRKEKIEKVKEEAEKSRFGGTSELDEFDDLMEGEAGEGQDEGKEEEEDKIISEDYEYANINRVIRTKPKTAEEDITESLYEDDADAETWKASKSTPYINEDRLAEIPDDDLRRMTANIGVSVSMLDEKASTAKVLETLGEARKKRVNMESLRLKSNDQFMLVGSSEAELIAKAGGIYDPAPTPKLAAEGEVDEEGRGSDSDSSGILRFSDDEDEDEGKKLEVKFDDAEEEKNDLADTRPASRGSNNSPGSGRSVKRGLSFEKGRHFARGKSNLEESDEESDDDEDYFAPRRSKVIQSKQRKLAAAKKSTEGEVDGEVDGGHQHGLGGDDDSASLDTFESGGGSAPFFSSSHLTDDQKSEAQGFTVEGLKRSKSDAEIEHVLKKKASHDQKLNEMKHYRTPTPQDGLARSGSLINMYSHYPLALAEGANNNNNGGVGEIDESKDGSGSAVITKPSISTNFSRSSTAPAGGKRPAKKAAVPKRRKSGLFVKGTSNLALQPVSQETSSFAGGGKSLDGMSLDTSVLELGGGEKLTVSVRGLELDSAENSLSEDQWTVPDDAFFDQLDNEETFGKFGDYGRGDDDDDGESVEEIVSGILEKLSTLRGGSQVFDDETQSMVDGRKLRRSKGKMHVGTSGLKHKYAGQASVGEESTPFVDEKVAKQQKMKIDGASRHFGQKQEWPKGVEGEGEGEGLAGGGGESSRGTSRQLPTASSLTASSMNNQMDRRMGTASTWNTISSRPVSTSTSYGVTDSRPSTGQFAIRLTDSANVRIVRSQDGMEYIYKVYDKDERDGRAKKIATPAALPTQMLFDESGKVYGEVLKFTEDGEIDGEVLQKQDDGRAQTAGENMMRSPDKLNISGIKIVRNVVSRGDMEGRGGGRGRSGGLLDAAVSVDLNRPVTSPVKLPSWNLGSMEDRAKAWNNFEMGKMSEATSAAYQALLDDDDGMLFGEGIDVGGGFSGDIIPDDIKLVNFEEALDFDHPLRADIERLRREGPQFLFAGELTGEGEEGGTSRARDSAEVTEALKLAKEAVADQERQEREQQQQDEEDRAFEFEFEGQSGYRFFDDAELEELDASVSGGNGSPFSVTVNISKRGGGGEGGNEERNEERDSPEEPSMLSGGSSYMLGPQGSVDSVEDEGSTVKSQWTEVAVQDALRRLNAELATNEMSAQLTKFKDSVTRRRIEEAMVEASTLARQQMKLSSGGAKEEGSKMVLLGQTKVRTAERKKRKVMMKITQFEPKVDVDDESMKISLGEGRDGKEEEETVGEVEAEGVEEGGVEEEASGSLVGVGEDKMLDVTGIMNVDLGGRNSGEDEEPNELFEEDGMSQKRRAWNRTASAPAALGEEKVAKFKLQREETNASMETSEGFFDEDEDADEEEEEEEGEVNSKVGEVGKVGSSKVESEAEAEAETEVDAVPPHILLERKMASLEGGEVLVEVKGSGCEQVTTTTIIRDTSEVSYLIIDGELVEVSNDNEEKIKPDVKVNVNVVGEAEVEEKKDENDEVGEGKEQEAETTATIIATPVPTEEKEGEDLEEPSSISNVKFEEDHNIAAAPSTPTNQQINNLEGHEHRPITPMLSPKPPPGHYENMPKTPEITDRLMNETEIARREDDDEQSLASHIWKLDGDDPEFTRDGDDIDDNLGLDDQSDFVVMAADMSLISGTTSVALGFDPPLTGEGEGKGESEGEKEGATEKVSEDKPKSGVTSVESSRQSSRQGSRPGSSTRRKISPRLGEQTSVVSEASDVISKRGDTRVGKKKKKDKEKSTAVSDHSVSADSSVVHKPAAKVPAFRRETVKKVSPTKNDDWQKFSRKKELEENDRAEKRAFYLKMKRDSSKMGSRAASKLLGTGDGLDEVSLDSDDEYQAIENLDLEKFKDDPLDRKKVKQSKFKSLHSEGMDSAYFNKRRGPSMREKVRGKSYLLKEGFPEEMKGLKRRAGAQAGGSFDEQEGSEEEEEEEDGGILASLLLAAEIGGKEEEKKEAGGGVEALDLVSPEKVVLPKI